jgi:hypothetical protein
MSIRALSHIFWIGATFLPGQDGRAHWIFPGGPAPEPLGSLLAEATFDVALLDNLEAMLADVRYGLRGN